MELLSRSRRPRTLPARRGALLATSLLAGLVLVAAASAATGWGVPGAGAQHAFPEAPAIAPVSTTASLPAAAAAAPDREPPTPRGFDHAAHEAVPCTSCHGTGERHRTVLVTAARECAACHHAPERAQACSVCHPMARLPEPGTVRRDIALGVWQAPRSRTLPFGHRRHAAVDCGECHRTAITLAVDRACGSCHNAHHGPVAECSGCHATVAGVHTAAVHLGCAGAGCHAADLLPQQPFGRATCLACHAVRPDHEPGGDCATCHLLRSGVSP
jgi:hypothetical protein